MAKKKVKKTAVKKAPAKKGVVHKTDKNGWSTSCGLVVSEVVNARVNWKGVTCKRCLRSKKGKK